MILTKIPSQLIRIALEDMKATIAQGIQIDMRNWGHGKLSEKEDCSVCFAGSVMLQRTNVGEEPYKFKTSGDNASQYYFLDSIRKGELKNAMGELKVKCKNSKEDPLTITEWVYQIPNWVNYSYSPETQEAFFTQMEQLADNLETKGF